MTEKTNTGLLDAIIAAAPMEPEVLELPGWQPGSRIHVRVKRPSLFALLAADAVLNPLIPEMNKLFIGHDRGDAAKGSKEYAAALVEIAKVTLVEPTYDELTAAGVTLTDDQLTDISLFATEGMDWLNSFRARTRDRAGQHGEPVQRTAEPAVGDKEPTAGMGAG